MKSLRRGTCAPPVLVARLSKAVWLLVSLVRNPLKAWIFIFFCLLFMLRLLRWTHLSFRGFLPGLCVYLCGIQKTKKRGCLGQIGLWRHIKSMCRLFILDMCLMSRVSHLSDPTGFKCSRYLVNRRRNGNHRLTDRIEMPCFSGIHSTVVYSISSHWAELY